MLSDFRSDDPYVQPEPPTPPVFTGVEALRHASRLTEHLLERASGFPEDPAQLAVVLELAKQSLLHIAGANMAMKALGNTLRGMR
jgi:hypothetical protein